MAMPFFRPLLFPLSSPQFLPLDKILRSYNQKRLPRLDLFSTELKFASVLSQSVGCQVSKNSTTAHLPFLHSLDRSIPGIVKQGRNELPRPPSLLLQILQDHRLTPVWSWLRCLQGDAQSMIHPGRYLAASFTV